MKLVTFQTNRRRRRSVEMDRSREMRALTSKNNGRTSKNKAPRARAGRGRREEGDSFYSGEGLVPVGVTKRD